MVDDGQLTPALDALIYYRDQGSITLAQQRLMAEIYVALHDGVASEGIVQRLRRSGTSREETALLLAQSLMLQGRFRAAERALRDQRVPQDEIFASFLLRGDIARALGDYERAAAFYQAAIDSEPSSYRGYTAMTLLRLQEANLDEAKRLAETAAERGGEDTMLSYVQGMVARYTGDTAAAKAHFLQATALNETNLLARLELAGIYLAEGNPAGTEEQLDAVYSVSPNNPHANYFTALLMIDHGDAAGASDILLRSGDFTRTYPPAARVYGLASHQLARYAAAIPYLSRALRIFPNDADIRLALADSLTRGGEAREALKVLEPVLASGDNLEAFLQAAAAAGGRGDVRAARRHMDAALALAAARGDEEEGLLADVRRRAALARFLDDDADGAIELLRSMYQGEEPDSLALMMQANMYLDSGNLAEAEAVIEQLQGLGSGAGPVADNLLGSLRHRQGRFEEALVAYSKAIDQSPQYQSALKNRALTYLYMEQFEPALGDLTKLVKLAPQEPQVAAMMGRAMLETGDAAGAVSYLDQAIEAMPQSGLVLADKAEAMAAQGFYSSAISLATKARRLGQHKPGFVAYTDELLAQWQDARASQEAEEQVAEEARLEAASEQLAAERERQRALREEFGGLSEDEAEQAALLEELRKLAESGDEAAYVPSGEASDSAADTVRAQRNRLFGLWLAEQMGLAGEDAQRYATAMDAADASEPGDTDLIRKAIIDLESAGLSMTLQALEGKLTEFAAAAESGTEAPSGQQP